VDGVITVDLPPEEDGPLRRELEAHGLAVRANDGTWAPGPRLLRYAQAVPTGRRLAWDKTIHRFPGISP
jgi:DNA-binding IclR family transcriptional regulator